MKRIWAALYPLKCAGDDLLEEVSEGNLEAFTVAFKNLQEVLGEESLDLSSDEFSRLDEVVKDFGKFRLGKRRLSQLRGSRRPDQWELEDATMQIRQNVRMHTAFCAKIHALRRLYDSQPSFAA